MKKIPRLTDLEISIMMVLWDEEEKSKEQYLTIQQITGHMDGLSVPSLTQAMKHLLNKEAVAVDQHILVSNVYARTFKPLFSKDEFYKAEIMRIGKCLYGEDFEIRKVVQV